ncbi:MAG: AAA family ATPase, partial [Candidatus Methanomethylophilaceae archaeon]|nr:AAA family ATPase [Candidatus Methanomethylophilaceae archaeon]
MKILLVTGMPGAGKEELLNVARSMDIPFLRMGDIVREFHQTSGAAERGLSVGQV